MSDGATNSTDPDVESDSLIEVVLPARTDMAATLRVLVASLGADVGFTLDEIDDMRLAVNEAFASAADDDGADRFSVTFRPGVGDLSITLAAVGARPIELDDLATTIMTSVVDEMTVTDGVVSLRKRAAEADG